jgi:hypothetical protein
MTENLALLSKLCPRKVLTKRPRSIDFDTNFRGKLNKSRRCVFGSPNLNALDEQTVQYKEVNALEIFEGFAAIVRVRYFMSSLKAGRGNGSKQGAFALGNHIKLILMMTNLMGFEGLLISYWAGSKIAHSNT